MERPVLGGEILSAWMIWMEGERERFPPASMEREFSLPLERTPAPLLEPVRELEESPRPTVLTAEGWREEAVTSPLTMLIGDAT